MKILYIPQTIKIREKSIINFLKCVLYDIYIILKNISFHKKAKKNTSGYFDSSIHVNAFTFELPYNFCIIFSTILNKIFDGIFINWKFTNLRNDPNLELKLIKLSRKFKIKKVIVDNRDTGDDIIRKEILDNFDNVIKREKNKSIINNKYLTTMLPCTLIDYKILKKEEKINWNKIGKNRPNNKFKYDIFFSGSHTSKKRSEMVEFLKSKNLNFYGGLKEARVPYDEYLKAIYNSSINLAIAGVGEFTGRHLEILCNCSFLMCHEAINKIELPIPIKDGKHFITYKNHEDLFEKITFFLENKEVRQNIALNGRKVLENYYSPKKHGDNILKKIFPNKYR